MPLIVLVFDGLKACILPIALSNIYFVLLWPTPDTLQYHPWIGSPHILQYTENSPLPIFSVFPRAKHYPAFDGSFTVNPPLSEFTPASSYPGKTF